MTQARYTLIVRWISQSLEINLKWVHYVDGLLDRDWCGSTGHFRLGVYPHRVYKASMWSWSRNTVKVLLWLQKVAVLKLSAGSQESNRLKKEKGSKQYLFLSKFALKIQDSQRHCYSHSFYFPLSRTPSSSIEWTGRRNNWRHCLLSGHDSCAVLFATLTWRLCPGNWLSSNVFRPSTRTLPVISSCGPLLGAFSLTLLEQDDTIEGLGKREKYSGLFTELCGLVGQHEGRWGNREWAGTTLCRIYLLWGNIAIELRGQKSL